MLGFRVSLTNSLLRIKIGTKSGKPRVSHGVSQGSRCQKKAPTTALSMILPIHTVTTFSIEPSNRKTIRTNAAEIGPKRLHF